MKGVFIIGEVISFKRESKKIMDSAQHEIDSVSSAFAVMRRMRIKEGGNHDGPTLDAIHMNEQAAVEKLKTLVPDSEMFEKIVRCIRWSWWERGFVDGHREGRRKEI